MTKTYNATSPISTITSLQLLTLLLAFFISDIKRAHADRDTAANTAKSTATNTATNVATNAATNAAKNTATSAATNAAKNADVTHFPAPVIDSSATANTRPNIHLYASALGFASGSFISEPKSKTLMVEGQTKTLPYPGFGGVGGGGGLLVGARWRALSLDVGVEWSVDSAEGRIDGEAVTLNQTTMHIPISLRAGIPSGSVRPSIFGGVDFVNPSDAGLEVSPQYSASISGVESERYIAGRFGFGLDFAITDALSVPLRLVGVYAPTSREDLSERVIIDEINGNAVVMRYISKWEWQARLMLGVTYEFTAL